MSKPQFLSQPEENLAMNAYLKVREREDRIYNIEEIQRLPFVPEGHIYQREWQIRTISATALQKYLEHRPGPILDLGCGNGWLTNFLANRMDSHITGLDLNQLELEQACQAFRSSNLNLVYGNIFDDIFEPASFQSILLAGSVHYFKDKLQLFNRLKALLRPGGEIHLVDSPIYPESEISAAKERSRVYFEELGTPEMIDHYWPTSWRDLDGFQRQVAFDPWSLPQRILKKFGNGDIRPFPWIILTCP